MTATTASSDDGHRNNLDTVRIGAAILVLVGHSYALNRLPEFHFLSWLPLGPLGVYIFFTISGYLVVESWRRDPHVGRFLVRRALRIFPGLAVCILLSAFVLGPALTSLPLGDYLRHEVVQLYLWNILLYPVFSLPGVFEHNPYPHAVNGSLWSLPIEFAMYLGVVVIGLVRGNRWACLGMAIGSVLVALYWADVSTNMIVVWGSDLRQFVWCGTFFWIGAVFREFGLARSFSLSGTVLALLALLSLEPWTSTLRVAAWVLLPVVVLGFGLARSPVLAWVTRTGDYSYGVYIYAFPVQQVVAALWPGLSIGAYIAVVIGIVLILAVLSWHLVEARALRLKPRRPSSR